MLRVRLLGRVPYGEALVLQRALHDRSVEDHLLVLEHPHVFTLGVRADPAHVLVDPARVGADLVRADRGGDVTYHGPGQLVVYPVVGVVTAPRAIPCHVHAIEQVVIDTLGELGLVAGRLAGYPGVWVGAEGPAPRKICAVGVRVSRGRSMHGLALNVDPDLAWFGRIVPCGIADMGVTSMAAEGVATTLGEVAEVLVRHAVARWGADGHVERQDVDGGVAARRPASDPVPIDPPPPAPVPSDPVPADPGPAPAPAGAGIRAQPAHRGPGRTLQVRLRRAGVDPDAGLPLGARKPPWLRVPLTMGPDFLALRGTVRDLGLVTVCEEAGCPNIFECWAEGTATFMINGERCTRACGFCLVDTRRPGPLDRDEPERVAAAVERLGLAHAVVTGVARDDLPDGG
ncbi:MAG TPA: lipoyl(octanoyl) transferase LipB, partial [Acidimicrobiales bacterium]|nr:lipoyl(octanoyl) transferase LipB [Acidimicrobiales bacterium]